MILGMSIATFTTVHVILSLIGIASGIVVLFGMLGGKRLHGLTAIFLALANSVNLVNFIVKRVVRRERPTAERVHVARLIHEPSFPSGHVLRAVIAYGLLAFVIRRLSPSPRIRALAVAGAVAIIVLVSFDRLYLDVHWESDVIGGLFLGAIALLAGTVWLDRPKKVEN